MTTTEDRRATYKQRYEEADDGLRFQELTYTGSQKVRLDDLRSLAARRLAEADDEWAQFLREEHAELIAAPVE